MIYSNSELIKLLRENNHIIEVCVQLIEDQSVRAFVDSEKNFWSEKLQSVNRFFLKQWNLPKISRKWTKFATQNKNWLESSTTFQSNRENPKSGRPSVDFDKASERTKRRRIADVVEVHETSSNLFIAAARRCCALENDHSKYKKLTGIINEGDEKENVQENSKVITPVQALTLLLDANLSVDQYNKVRSVVHSTGHKIFPSYNTVAAEKKKCFPSGIKATPTCAEVPWKNLVKHTCERIVEYNRDVIENKLLDVSDNVLHVKFIISVGMDGTSNQSQFNQQLNENSKDSSLFVTAMAPLQLETANSMSLWTNPCPHSTRFCRTQKLIFKKECAAYSLSEYKDIMKQLNEIEEFSIPLSSGKFL